LLFLIFSLLFFPLKPTLAFLGVGDIGIFDLAEVQLDALDFVDNVVLQVILFLALLLAESQVFLYVTANLLQWAINFPINLHNDLVLSGWHFTIGLTNLFLILIFVVIAIAYILKIESFAAKKALPRLIIVALLMNFSLVFIGIFVDIAQIILKSIVNALGTDLPSLAIAPLVSNIGNLIIGYGIALGTWAAVTLIPYANVAASYILLMAVVVGEAFFGTYSLSILLIILGFVLGLIFLTYFVIFLMRIAIIWILAILSPLAFACWILPQTEKHWKEWLQELTEWLTFGILIILLAGLGLKLFALNTVVPGTGPISIGGMGLFPAFTYNYVFLLVYLGVVFYYSKKYTPQLATVLIGYATTLGKGTQRLATTTTMKRQLWGPAAERAAKGFAGAAKRLEPLGKLSYQFRGRTVKPLSWTTRAAQAPVAPLIEYAAKQRRVTLPAGWKQMSIPEKVMYVDALRRDSDKLVLASEMKGEKTLQKAEPKFGEKMFETANRMRKDPKTKELYRKEIGDIIDAFPNKLTAEMKIDLEITPEDKKEMEDKIKKTAEEIEVTAKIDVKLNEEIEKSRGTIAREEYVKNLAAGAVHLREMKVADFPEVAKSSLTSLTGRLSTHGMTDRQIYKIYETFGKDVVDKLLEETGGLNAIFKGKTSEKATELLEKIYKENPKIIRFFAQTPAGRAMNWEGLKHMRDPYNQPTTTFAAFERRLKIQDILNTDSILKRYNKLQIDMKECERMINKNKIEGKPTTHWENRRADNIQKANQLWISRIAADFKRREQWEEIGRLRKPPKKRTLKQKRG